MENKKENRRKEGVCRMKQERRTLRIEDEEEKKKKRSRIKSRKRNRRKCCLAFKEMMNDFLSEISIY